MFIEHDPQIVLDLEQRVEDHRAAIVEIDLERIIPRVFAAVGIVAIDLEGFDSPGALSLVRAARAADLGILRKGEGRHGAIRSCCYLQPT